MANAIGSWMTMVTVLALGALGTMACDGETESGTTSFDAGPTGAFDASAPPAADASVSPETPRDAAAVDSAPPKAPQLAFATGFETGIPPEVTPATALLTPTAGFAALGPAGRTFGATFLRSATANVVTLSFKDLPPHRFVTLGFLFAAIDSLDGTGTFPAGDFFKVTVDGKVVFRESFANAQPGQVQSYVPPAGGELARRVDLGFVGPGGFYTDSAYDMALEPKLQNIPHTAATLVIELTVEGEGTQSLDDESWAVDELRVTTVE